MADGHAAGGMNDGNAAAAATDGAASGVLIAVRFARADMSAQHVQQQTDTYRPLANKTIKTNDQRLEDNTCMQLATPPPTFAKY